MAFNWIQSKLKKQKKKEEAPQPVVAHQPTKTVFGPVPWTIWFDAGLELVCEEGRDEGRTIPLEHAFLVIGRGLNVEDHRDGWLLFTEETVSRRQAVLCWNEERNSYYLFHLAGATNGTYVDRRSGEQWRVGIGSTVEMGYLRYRIQRRLQIARASSFVLDTLERLGRGIDDAAVKTGLALTIINGAHRGNTFLLSRKYHVLHKTTHDSGNRLLDRGQPPELEHDILVWNDEAQAYELVHNPKAIGPTFVHAGRPSHQFDIFAQAPEPGIEVFSGSPILLREGDTVRVGDLQVRLHRHIQCLLEGSINHILQKGYIEKIPSVDTLIAQSAAPPPERLDAPVHTPPQSLAREVVPAPVQAPPAAEEEDAGWVDPDRAPVRQKRANPHEPIVADRSEAFHTPSRRMPKVSPGGASADDEAPRRKPRGGVTPPARIQPTDEPLPFDIVDEPTIPRPAQDQPRPAIYVQAQPVEPEASMEPEAVEPEAVEAEVEAEIDAPPAEAEIEAPPVEAVIEAPPLEAAAPPAMPMIEAPREEAEAPAAEEAETPREEAEAPLEETEAPADEAELETITWTPQEVEAQAVAAPEPPPPVVEKPSPVVEKPAPVAARPIEPRVVEKPAPPKTPPLAYVSPRQPEPPAAPPPRTPRLSLSIPVRGEEKGAAPPPPPPTPAAPPAAEAKAGPVRAYELEVVAGPGLDVGAVLQVAGASRIDVERHPRLTFGNAEGSDVRVPADATMAASHAIIEATERGLVLRPLQGMPMVNKSICVKESLLRPGDEIRLTRASALRLRVIE